MTPDTAARLQAIRKRLESVQMLNDDMIEQLTGTGREYGTDDTVKGIRFGAKWARDFYEQESTPDIRFLLGVIAALSGKPTEAMVEAARPFLPLVVPSFEIRRAIKAAQSEALASIGREK